MARLREIRQQALIATMAEHRMNVAVKLDRWEGMFLAPAGGTAPEAPKPAAPDSERSIERKALLKRIAEDEAQLRQLGTAAMAQLSEIQKEVTSATTDAHWMSAAVKLDSLERQFLATP